MINKEENEIQWLEFELLADQPRLKHGVFLRHGGVSQGKYASLNLSSSVGDDPAAVKENQRRATVILNSSPLVYTKQVHGSHVIEVTESQMQLEPADGMITKKRDLPLTIHHADCQAAIFYDPVEHVLAVVHSGWRGSVQNIYKQTIDSMKNKYGSKAENLLVGISPSLGPNHAEFINYKQEFPEKFWEFQVKPLYFDFWAISEMQLKAEGVLTDHIQIAGICTFANQQDCYSYRRDKIKGGHGTVAVLL